MRGDHNIPFSSRSVRMVPHNRQYMSVTHRTTCTLPKIFLFRICDVCMCVYVHMPQTEECKNVVHNFTCLMDKSIANEMSVRRRRK